jgi:hypothetical protein
MVKLTFIYSALNVWLEIIKNVADEHAPWKEFKRKGQNKFIPWYTKELEDIAKRKNMYLKLLVWDTMYVIQWPVGFGCAN